MIMANIILTINHCLFSETILLDHTKTYENAALISLSIAEALDF